MTAIRVSAYLVLFAFAVLAVSYRGLATAGAQTGVGYRYYVTGNRADVQPATRGLIVMQGGGDDVDENFVRMGRAGGGGDFVVLQAAGGDAYNDYIFKLCACDSVETLEVTTREAASDAFVVQTVRHAEALFIAGGDQGDYLRLWQGTPLEQAINAVAAKPAPVGGTSAGMAILGEFSHSSLGVESLTSAHALADPYAPDLTLARDFIRLPVLTGLITDQHLKERDRMGRTLTMLARLRRDGWSQAPRAIAADRETAVHVDPRDGSVEVLARKSHSTPFVYMISAGQPATRCEPGSPLTIRDVDVYRLQPGARFNLRNWRGEGGIAYTLSVEAGEMTSSRGAIY